MGWREFTMPGKNEFDETTLSDVYGKFVMEPFERGYALTLGNALRRALISSIESAAPVSVKMDGVPHEFGTIRGVLEDVMDIILNIRQVRMRMSGKPPKSLRLEISGERAVTAADFEPNPEIEILNPGQHIATLTEKESKIMMEISVDAGRGFVPAGPQGPEVGIILLDANFSPVTKVKYEVENTRVGQRTDFERLVMEIWTDGRITPEKAMNEAAFILREHFALLVKEGEGNIRTQHAKETEHKKELMLRLIEDTELSPRAKNSLQTENIKTLGDLVSKTEEDLLKFKNLGRKSLEEIKDTLGTMGLSLGMDISQILGAEQN